jgi:signal recognition particle subunit SRP72
MMPVLSIDPAAVPAFQTLLFLYLQTDAYTSALALVESPPSGAASSLDFERAYCLYRLHREKEALAVLDGLGDKGRKVEHLEAQIVSAWEFTLG